MDGGEGDEEGFPQPTGLPEVRSFLGLRRRPLLLAALSGDKSYYISYVVSGSPREGSLFFWDRLEQASHARRH